MSVRPINLYCLAASEKKALETYESMFTINTSKTVKILNHYKSMSESQLILYPFEFGIESLNSELFIDCRCTCSFPIFWKFNFWICLPVFKITTEEHISKCRYLMTHSILTLQCQNITDSRPQAVVRLNSARVVSLLDTYICWVDGVRVTGRLLNVLTAMIKAVQVDLCGWCRACQGHSVSFCGRTRDVTW